MGIMGVNYIAKTAGAAFVTSRPCTDVIFTAIIGKGDFSVYDHLQKITQAKKEMNHEVKGLQENVNTEISEWWEEMSHSNSSKWQDIHLAGCTSRFPLLTPSKFHDITTFRLGIKKVIEGDSNRRRISPTSVPIRLLNSIYNIRQVLHQNEHYCCNWLDQCTLILFFFVIASTGSLPAIKLI